jgi:hypothetical protein
MAELDQGKGRANDRRRGAIRIDYTQRARIPTSRRARRMLSAGPDDSARRSELRNLASCATVVRRSGEKFDERQTTRAARMPAHGTAQACSGKIGSDIRTGRHWLARSTVIGGDRRRWPVLAQPEMAVAQSTWVRADFAAPRLHQRKPPSAQCRYRSVLPLIPQVDHAVA